MVRRGSRCCCWRGRCGVTTPPAAAARAGHGALVAVVSLLLALHLAPGFDNPVVIREAVLSPGAIGYTQYANFDKGLAGALMVATLGLAGLRSADAWGPALRQAGPIGLVTI